ncbi:MAG: hypothetical protein ACE5ER_10255 [Nitrospinaceae bacterium]
MFPLLEPVFVFFENLKPEVRRHFDQAVRSLESENVAVSLLNLNMVLSLRPSHFLARVYRGRIYLREGQYRLASNDFLQANKISSFRFTHYGLYHEYLNSVTDGMGSLGKPIFQRFSQGLGSSRLDQDASASPELPGFEESFQARSGLSFFPEEVNPETLELTPDEVHKFQGMGPITGKEVKDTDWDSVLKKLST